MDTITFRIGSRSDVVTEDPVPAVEVSINGRDLIELAAEAERHHAHREGRPGLAGCYVGLPPEDVFLPSRRLLGEPAERYKDFEDHGGKISILGCGCGEVGCWPLRVRITRWEGRVVWNDFEQPHRSRLAGALAWSYDDLGPFVFDEAQYLAELGGPARELRSREPSRERRRPGGR